MTRALVVLAVLAASCATAQDDKLGDWRDTSDIEPPPPPPRDKLADSRERPEYPEAPPRPIPQYWGAKDHPIGYAFAAGVPGEMTLRTSGTALNRNETVDASMFRLAAAAGRQAGLELSWWDSDAFTGGLKYEVFDMFGHGQVPMWPNRRLRFLGRGGLYYNNTNAKNAGPTDVEGWSWGFRLDVEGEVDVIKGPVTVVSVFANGRFGFGWGDAKTGGLSESITASDWGWEAGARLHWGQFFLAVSWIERTTEWEGSFRFDEARYGMAGAQLTFGLRF